jgi:hypothetical protein
VAASSGKRLGDDRPIATAKALCTKSDASKSLAAAHNRDSSKLNGNGMSNTNHFRKWAAQVARQAGEEPDAAEAQRLLSIAEYWVRLADGAESSQSVAGVGLTET